MAQRQRKTTAPDARKAPTKPRLSAQDWADAALTAIGEGGLAAVAVEPLAVRLGTTKGSFYWHFANRDALIKAALERWAEINTEGIISEVEAEPDIRTRIRLLFAEAISSASADPLEVYARLRSSNPAPSRISCARRAVGAVRRAVWRLDVWRRPSIMRTNASVTESGTSLPTARIASPMSVERASRSVVPRRFACARGGKHRDATPCTQYRPLLR